MLSHLVGSSNRADIARLSELEFELADALEKNKSLIVRNQEKLNNLRKEIDEEFSQGVLLSGENYTTLLSEHEQRRPKVVSHNLRLLDDIERINSEKQELQSKLECAQDELEDLQAELHSANTFIQGFITKSESNVPKCNLYGKCILYIGVRESNICRMCELVGKMNGRLIHHDGGREDSLAKLQGAISSADAVIFPVDCVSYSSALEAKKLCKKMVKPFMPIRSSSLSSLVSGLAEFKFDDNNREVFKEGSSKP